MAALIPVGEIRKFFGENKSGLQDEYRLVAEEKSIGVEIYITEDEGLPYFLVEVDGKVKCEAKASFDSQIEEIYSLLLEHYLCEEESDEVLSSKDLDRLEEIRFATIDYLSILLECNPEECFDDDCIEEIASAFEEYLYDAYGFSVRHPIADGNKIIQFPYSEEV